MTKPQTFYHSETTSWTSSPKNGKQFGKRNVVTIKNGKGTKVVESLNKNGNPTKKVKKALKKKEVDKVLKGKFIKRLGRLLQPRFMVRPTIRLKTCVLVNGS